MDEIVAIEGLSIIRQDRNVHGGGVALYVSEQYGVKVLSHSKTEGKGKPGVLEYLICSLHKGTSEPILACVIYRPPHVAFTQDSDLLNKLRDLTSSFSHKVILGDLNSDLCTDNSDAVFLRNLAAEMSLQIIQHGPTHISPTFKTWIDVVLVDDNEIVRTADNIEAPYHSKHNIINVVLQLPAPELVCSSYSYRNYRDIDGASLVQFLECCDWDAVNAPDLDVESAVNLLNSNLMGGVEALAPLKHVQYANKRFPWIGVELRDMQRKSKTLYRRYRRTGRTHLLEEFLELRRRVQEETDQARTDYVHNRLFKSHNSNTIWRELRDLGLLPRKKRSLHGLTPDELNTHFASVSISSSNEETNGCHPGHGWG